MGEAISGHNKTGIKRRRATWERAFLASLALTGNVSEAARSATVARGHVYEWRDKHADFAAEWDVAMEEAADYLETEARRRAVEGVEEPVYQRGERVGTIRRYSDTLLIFLLNGARPQKYKAVVRNEVTGADGKEVLVKVLRGVSMDDL